MKQLEGLKEELSSPKKIVIFPHRNPDGDAIGSTLGLQHFLEKKGHQVVVIAPNDFPKFLKWLPKAKEILIAEYQLTKAKRLIEQADLLFCLDFNALHRLGNELPVLIEATKVPKILIDHHQQPDVFDYMYSDTGMPATCQMVYHFIEQMDEVEKIDLDIAQCLYTGILTDTGGFRFSTKESTHLVAAALVAKGVSPAEISTRILDAQSEGRLKILAEVLSEMEVLTKYKTSILRVTRKQLNENSYQKGDTEGFVNYGLNIEGQVLSVFFIEDTQHDYVKMSFRSKGNFDVNQLARKHFNGGGHVNAAGGRSDEDMKASIERFVGLLEEYKEELKNTQI